jgi:hypothetical protein
VNTAWGGNARKLREGTTPLIFSRGFAMADETEVVLPASEFFREAAKKFTIQVRMTGAWKWRLRLWVGLRLIRLGSWIAGTNLEVVHDEVPDEEG